MWSLLLYVCFYDILYSSLRGTLTPYVPMAADPTLEPSRCHLQSRGLCTACSWLVWRQEKRSAGTNTWWPSWPAKSGDSSFCIQTNSSASQMPENWYNWATWSSSPGWQADTTQMVKNSCVQNSRQRCRLKLCRRLVPWFQVTSPGLEHLQN